MGYSISGNQGFVAKATRAKAAQPVVYQKGPEAEELLRAYFTDGEDVQRFIDEERRGREERDKKSGR